MRTLLLCTSPRSGSTMCLKLLEAAGQGPVFTPFHWEAVVEWAQHLGLPRGAALSAVFATLRYAAPAVIRLQEHSRARLMGHLATWKPQLENDAARLREALGPFDVIYLHRKDTAAQAVSCERGRQSGLWHAHPDGTALEQVAPTRPSGFNLASLRAERAHFEAAHLAWLDWFESQNLAPVHLTYEALAANPHHVLNGALARLDRPKLPMDLPLQTKRLGRDDDPWLAALRGTGQPDA